FSRFIWVRGFGSLPSDQHLLRFAVIWPNLEALTQLVQRTRVGTVALEADGKIEVIVGIIRISGGCLHKKTRAIVILAADRYPLVVQDFAKGQFARNFRKR